MDTTTLARKTAARSPCRYKVAALVLDSKGNVLSCAHNMPRLMRKGGGIHAEVSAIRKANKRLAHTILLVRVGKSGELRPIHPCPACLRLINKLGLKVSV